MKLTLKDIGPIKDGELILTKLTVLAGKNGTGKSIASRLLFVSLLGLSDYLNFWMERVDMLLRALEVWSYEYKVNFREVRSILRKFKDELRRWQKGASFPLERLRDLKRELFSLIREKLGDNFLLKRFLDSFEKYFPKELRDERALVRSMIISAVEWLLNEEFEGVENLIRFNSERGYFSLNFSEIEGKALEVHLEQDGDLKIDLSSVDIYSLPVIYLVGSYLNLLPLGEILIWRGEDVESPFHLAELFKAFQRSRLLNVSHDKVRIYEEILLELEKLLGGSLSFSNEEEISFKREDGEVISVLNLASGERVLVTLHLFLKRLLEMYDKFILIFDEPETHLHPQWQVELSKFMVKLAKLGIPILLSTHSPYIVQAIRVFSHDIGISVNYVLATYEEDGVVLRDVTDESNVIIRELSEPFMGLVWR